ncbi:hypothetical protein ABZY68_03200 [Streptomyces sp. NPDC006482]|uniref:hypothetical protein n=1 Tax=unclassified Streptomyces TaxID=2593676 RepID=UPI00224F1E57|nr:hypothetical protein [Streptomyces sp. NBC_00094]MCX5394176.1 hypothetical protein [Streptomyces sp. NBC_00094]
MRRAAVVGATAVLALAAVAVTSSEESAVPGEEGGTRPMPDFLGGRLWRVFTGLDPRTRLDVHDVSGRDRRVLWPPNWRVCTQYPAVGTTLDRRTTVMIGVVRRGETCPPRVRTARR